MKKLLLLFLLLNIWFIGFSQDGKVKPSSFSKAIYFDRIGPLKDFLPMTSDYFKKQAEREKIKERNKDSEFRSYPVASNALPVGEDEVWQKQNGKVSGVNHIITVFEGQSTPSYPPDCNGAAGNDHFLQTVNLTYSIYEKNGVQVVSPTNLNTLFAGVPGSNVNEGDPIVLYDDNADRWLVAEFSGAAVGSYPHYMMIAISVTNDPTGDWYRWSWVTYGFADYMKFGVWEDGYYMGSNTRNGDDIYVFERSEMLSGGSSPQLVQFDNPWRPETVFQCTLPADCDGEFAQVGTPGLFLAINDDSWGNDGDELWVCELDVDWNNPDNSTWDRTQQISVTPFDSNFGPYRQNITQPGTNNKIDALSELLMFRVQYRNFGSEKRMLCNHTVDVDHTDHAGIRWYELELVNGLWEIRQEGTYAPDSNSRWMASIAMNGNKEIALGYSVSSSIVFPGIRYCGQSSMENEVASGIMDIEEGVIVEGTQAQLLYDRWGDYSCMSVDPVDDKTFWFTSEYIIAEDNKGTKIASLYFLYPPLASFTASSTMPIPADTVSFTDLSLNTPTSWFWNFEGGNPSSSTEQNPEVTYGEIGIYDVTLIVENIDGSDTLVKENYINVIEDILVVDPVTDTVPMEAGSNNIVLSVNRFWNATSDCDWVTISPNFGFSGGDISINYDENIGTIRQCIITFATVTNSTDYLLVQSGIAEILTLTPLSSIVNYTASSIDVAIGSNTDWNILETCDWMSVSAETGSGNESLVITYDENLSNEDRDCIITVVSNTLSVDFDITQMGYPASITTNILADTVISINSSIDIEVISNVQWTVDEQCDWITIEPESGTGNTGVNIQYSENESIIYNRVCTIRFIGGGTSALFELTQLAKVAFLELNTNEHNVDWEEDSLKVDVTSNIDWSVSNTCDWINVQPITGSNSGSFTVGYSGNDATTDRSCTLHVSGESLMQELLINQYGNPDGIDELEANEISIYPSPASHSIHIESKVIINRIQIVDLSGNIKVDIDNPGSKIIITTSGWETGIYCARIFQGQTQLVGKFEIQ